MPPSDRLRKPFDLYSTGCPTAELDNIVAHRLKNLFGLFEENRGKPLVQCLLVFWYVPVRRTDTPTSGLCSILAYLMADKCGGAVFWGFPRRGT